MTKHLNVKSIMFCNINTHYVKIDFVLDEKCSRIDFNSFKIELKFQYKFNALKFIIPENRLIPSTVIRWCVFFIDSLIESTSRGRMDLKFIISAEIPSFASSSAASTQKWTPIECATKVISFPARCIRAYFQYRLY